MSRQYHYLVAGLPELIFEDKKLVHTSADFRNYLSEHSLMDLPCQFIEKNLYQLKK